MITPTKEDYLRAIHRLEEDLHRNVKAIEVAQYLNLAKSTVSERLQELAKLNLIKHKKYSHIEFTAKGKKIAKNLTYKHRIIESFLFTTLKLKKDKIHDEAHRLEHAFSDLAITKLNQFMGSPKFDPHGSPILK